MYLQFRQNLYFQGGGLGAWETAVRSVWPWAVLVRETRGTRQWRPRGRRSRTPRQEPGRRSSPCPTVPHHHPVIHAVLGAHLKVAVSWVVPAPVFRYEAFGWCAALRLLSNTESIMVRVTSSRSRSFASVTVRKVSAATTRSSSKRWQGEFAVGLLDC